MVIFLYNRNIFVWIHFWGPSFTHVIAKTAIMNCVIKRCLCIFFFFSRIYHTMSMTIWFAGQCTYWTDTTRLITTCLGEQYRPRFVILFSLLSEVSSHLSHFKGNEIHFVGWQLSNYFLYIFLKSSLFQMVRICSPWEQIISFYSRPLLQGDWCAEMQTGSHNNCFLYWKSCHQMAELTWTGAVHHHEGFYNEIKSC